MITVDFVSTDGDDLWCSRIPAVPRVGEQMTIRGVSYLVTSVGWGCMCTGDGEPIGGQIGATVEMKSVSE